MTSFLGKIFGRTTAPAKAAAAPVVQPKSAARLADERKILEARRTILANMARIEQQTGTKQTVVDLIDQDAERATQVVRNILFSEDRK